MTGTESTKEGWSLDKANEVYGWLQDSERDIPAIDGAVSGRLSALGAKSLQAARAEYASLVEPQSSAYALYVSGFSMEVIGDIGLTEEVNDILTQAAQRAAPHLVRAAANQIALSQEPPRPLKQSPAKVESPQQNNTVAVRRSEYEPLPSDFFVKLMGVEDEGYLAWIDRALCAQTDPNAFFPEKGGSTREAKSVCQQCDVRSECLEYALGNEERFGVWGGLTERERRILKRRKV